jgi:class 3 adenylate cyclase
MSDAARPSGAPDGSHQQAEVLALRAAVQRLEAENQRLHAQTASVAIANAHAAEVMAELYATQETLAVQNQRLQQQTDALATANAHAAELMVELHETQEALTAQNERLQERTEALAVANAHAAELMVELQEAQDLLQQQNEQLELHNQFIRQTFGRYLTNEVVASLLDSPDGLALGGEKRQVTLLMSDLRGFTTLSERLQPEQVVSILNRHLGAMVDVILRYHGTIDEFIGDAIFVIFGAPVSRPNAAQHAVACAVDMQLAMAAVNDHNRREGLPEVEMGIGIHTGEVVVGNIGSDKRAKYGVVGRHVNLTSRIESCTVGSQILISETTRREVGDLVSITKDMQVTAKGVAAPIKLYEVCGVGSPYNLSLPIHTDRFVPLPQPLMLQFTLLEGKHLQTAPFTGTLVKASAKGGEICSEQVIAPLSDLSMQLFDGHGHAVPGRLYGKVQPSAGAQSTCFAIRFTSVAPGAMRFLQHCLAGHEARVTW